MRLDMRPGSLRTARKALDRAVPKGYRLAAVTVKGYLVRDDERGRP